MVTNRRHDPGRRDRIIDASLTVIAQHGVAGTSARRVAVAADVPLGSMTYHFDGMDVLLRAAFARFSMACAERVERRMASATTSVEARDAVLRLITDDVFTNQRDLVLTHELYTLAAREPSYRALTHDWMQRSHAALAAHFDDDTAYLLDALIEGLTIHRALDVEPHDVALARVAVERITAGSTTSPG